MVPTTVTLMEVKSVPSLRTHSYACSDTQAPPDPHFLCAESVVAPGICTCLPELLVKSFFNIHLGLLGIFPRRKKLKTHSLV